MTPREKLRDETDSSLKPFTSRELVLHGRPNRAAALFFACVASLHAYIAVHSFGTSHWQGLISATLTACFLTVSILCMLARSQISIRPRQRQIHIRGGIGRLAIDRDTPFSAVRAVRVTLWQSRRGQQSRLEILCNGEEIPCPPTTIPRQQALYLALVMNVHLIKISDDLSGNALVHERLDSARW